MTAIYLVETPTGRRLVRAINKSAAINYTIRATVQAKPLTAAEVVDLIAGGLKVEEVLTQPAAPETAPQATESQKEAA